MDAYDRKIKGYDNYRLIGKSDTQSIERFTPEKSELKKIAAEFASLGCERVIVEGPAGNNGFRLQIKIWQGKDLQKLVKTKKS